MSNALIRIAIRDEGEFTVAYVAGLDPGGFMVPVASLRNSLVNLDEEAFEEWREVLQQLVARMVKKVTGINVTSFEFGPLAEHEKVGHG